MPSMTGTGVLQRPKPIQEFTSAKIGLLRLRLAQQEKADCLISFGHSCGCLFPYFLLYTAVLVVVTGFPVYRNQRITYPSHAALLAG
jgi:hypothetical protein